MKKIKNMKIKKLLLFGFGSIILLSTIIIICSILSIRNVSKNVQDMYNKPYQANDLMWGIRRELVSIERMLYKGLATIEEAESKAAIDSTNESIVIINENIQKLEDMFVSEDKIKLFDEIKALLSEGSALRSTVGELIIENKNEEALTLIKNEYSVVFDNAVNKVVTLSNLVKEDATGFVETSSRSSTFVILFMLVALIIGIIFSIIITTVTTKIIVVPISEVMKGIQAISEGNLGERIVYESRNEFGILAECARNTMKELKNYIDSETYVLQRLASKDMTVKLEEDFKGDFKPIKDAFEEIIIFLNDMLHKTREAAIQVHAASSQVAEISQNLASEATEEAAATEEISATVNAVTDNVEKNAKNAENVNEISNESVTMIEQGNECMDKLVVAIQDISKQSNQISSIIQVIDDIASQTNLLALNASIEAARAGEHGKGFAVVAGEIGNLASESAKAARNITDLIQTSLSAVENGTQLADETAGVLKEIVNSVEKTSNLVSEISSACNEQAASLENILNGVNAVAEGSSNNSASATEASAASEELLAQAQVLQEMLDLYKLE